MGEESATYLTFRDFYPFYLSRHADRHWRWLHFAGMTLGFAGLSPAFSTLNFWYSLIGDWGMWRHMLAGRARY